jgi:flagellar basal-body rod modification protein FlgD
MAVDSLAATSSNTRTSSSNTGLSGLSTDEFTKIVFAELSNQDPMSPNDTNQLLQQISTIRSIQSDMDLSTSLTNLVGQNEFANAASLIGKPVSGVSEDRLRVEGIVQAVSRTKEGTVVTLDDGSRVNVTQLDEIFNPALIPDNDDDNDNTGNTATGTSSAGTTKVGGTT